RSAVRQSAKTFVWGSGLTWAGNSPAVFEAKFWGDGELETLSVDGSDIVCFLVTLYLPLKVVMVRYRSCSVMRCEDKFSSRHRFSDAANNLNLFQKWVLMKR
ncbi:hypothetical protein NQ317_003823, partial [Molorchus minor]